MRWTVVSRQLVWACVGIAITVAGAPVSQADVLYYGGDWYGNGSGSGTTTHIRNGSLNGDANYYQGFVVPTGQTWTVSELFSNNLVGPPPPDGFTGADWTIRSGVSAGNGGIVVASGNDATVSLAGTGRSWMGFNEETFTVNVGSIVLTAGTYWMDVTPVAVDDNGLSYQTWSVGANSVGTSTPDDYFYASRPGLTQDFLLTSSPVSDGIIGTAGPATATPEPSSIALFGMATVMLGGYQRWWRRKRRAIH